MAPRYLCLQGHLWTYQERRGRARRQGGFCPTCGLRLYAEAQVPTIPIQSQQFFPSPPPIPVQPPQLCATPPTPMISDAAGSADGAVDRPCHPGQRHRGDPRLRTARRTRSRRHGHRLPRAPAFPEAPGRPQDDSDRSACGDRPNARAFSARRKPSRRLQHPNIVQIYEVGEQNGLPYFSLEFVNAGSLAQFLGNHAQPARVCAAFVEELALAMHYAHKRGIVHRDLKPANILLHLDESSIFKDGQLTDSGASATCISTCRRSLDFGLAKHMGWAEDGTFRVGGARRHAQLHGSRAGPRQGPRNRAGRRYLCPGRDPLRDVDRPTAVQRPDSR